MAAYAHAHPDQVVTVYLDDVPVTRCPTLANGDGRAGADPVRAERSRATEGDLRSVGRLDVGTGQVITRRATMMGRATLAPCSSDRRAAAPEAARIAVILDKWPVHVHPDVLRSPSPPSAPGAAGPCASGCPGGACAAHDPLGVVPSRQWASPPSGRAVRRAGEVRRPIQRMPAPTDASWRHLVASSWGGGCGRRSPACTAGRQIAISCVAARMPSSRHVQPARQSSYRMSVSDSGLFIQRPSAHSRPGRPDELLNSGRNVNPYPEHP